MGPEFFRLLLLIILLSLLSSVVSADQPATIRARATVVDPAGFEVTELKYNGRNTHIEISYRHALNDDMVGQIIIDDSIGGEPVIIYSNPRDIFSKSASIALDIIQPGAENCVITIIDIAD